MALINVNSRRIFAYVAWILVKNSTDQWNFTYVPNDTRGIGNKKLLLHFLCRWFLPLVSTLLPAASWNRFFSIRAACYVTYCFHRKVRAVRSGPSSSEKNEAAKRVLIDDVVTIIIRTPVSLCAHFFRSFIATTRSGISDDVLFARNELNPSSSDSVR